MAKPSALFAVVLSILGCSGLNSRDHAYKDISQAEVREMLKSPAAPVVIDVRTPEEFDGELGHIAGARLIPLQVFPDSLRTISAFKDSTIIMVCRSGRRSAIASEMLTKAGFKKVFNLKGGMISWNKPQ